MKEISFFLKEEMAGGGKGGEGGEGEEDIL